MWVWRACLHLSAVGWCSARWRDRCDGRRREGRVDKAIAEARRRAFSDMSLEGASQAVHVHAVEGGAEHTVPELQQLPYTSA